MRILLDTHVFLWFAAADPSLPRSFQIAIRDPANQIFVSVVSHWEVVIKHGLGKLPLPSPPAVLMKAERIYHRMTSLPVDEEVMTHLARLPRVHRDPFDRMLVAQAIQHGLVMASVDPMVRTYPVGHLAIA